MTKIKTVALSSLVVVLTLGLSGCFGTSNNEAPTPSETISTEVKPFLANPIVNGLTSPVNDITLTPELNLKTFYSGLGYPNVTASNEFNKTEGTGTDLVADERIIGVTYTVTNVSDTPVSFMQPEFGTPVIAGQNTVSTVSDSSLPTLAGYSIAPTLVDGNVIEPGSSVTWSFIVKVPKEGINKENAVTFAQPIGWGNSTVSAEFAFVSKEPATKGVQTVNPDELEELEGVRVEEDE